MRSYYYYTHQTQTPPRSVQSPYEMRLLEVSNRAIRRQIRRRLAIGVVVLAIGAGVLSWTEVASAKNSSSATASRQATSSSSANSATSTTSTSSTTSQAAGVLGASSSTTSGALQHVAANDSIIAANSQYSIGVTVAAIGSSGVTSQQSYGVTAPFEAASTAKLLTAAAYYRAVEQGQASLDTQLGDYSAQYQLQEMVQQSDNDSWALLFDALGGDQIQAYASSIGIQYQVDDNTLSSSDMATFLGKLYSGSLLNSADTAQLLSYMQNTNDETLIPPVVPNDVTIYHKYGLLNGELHDVAILTKGGQSYALVIYTKDTDDSSDPARTLVIQSIAREVIRQLFNE